MPLNKTLLMTLALTVSASQVAVASVATTESAKAPAGHLELVTEEAFATQDGKLIFSTWEGEDYDDSYPPVEWPQAVRAPKGSKAAFLIDTPRPPDRVEIRIWKRLRSNGIPKGTRRTLRCVTIDLTGGCQILPSVVAQGVGWKVAFDIPDVEGHTYVSLLATWEGSEQVAWINHAILR